MTDAALLATRACTQRLQLCYLPAEAAAIAFTVVAGLSMLSDQSVPTVPSAIHYLQAQHCAMYAAPHQAPLHLLLLGFHLLARIALGLLFLAQLPDMVDVVVCPVLQGG